MSNYLEAWALSFEVLLPDDRTWTRCQIVRPCRSDFASCGVVANERTRNLEISRLVSESDLELLRRLNEDLLEELVKLRLAIFWFENHGWGKVSELCEAILADPPISGFPSALLEPEGKAFARILLNALEEVEK